MNFHLFEWMFFGADQASNLFELKNLQRKKKNFVCVELICSILFLGDQYKKKN